MRDKSVVPSVLVITDNPAIRFWVKKHLDSSFFVLDATAKDETQIVILDFPLDLILLDDAFPHMSPLEICAQIRATVLNSATPIFLITGRLNKSFRNAAIQAGVTDFLSSQLDADELKERVEEAEQANQVRSKTSTLFVHTPKQNPTQAASLTSHSVLREQAAQLFANEQKKTQPASLLVLKIDQFLHLENSVKEELMPLFSQFLTHCTSQKDLTVPLKEGRFTVLLPDTQIEQATKIVQVLQTELKKHSFNTKNGQMHLSTSVALSQVNGNDKSFEELIELANEAFDQTSSSNATISLDKGTK